MAARSEKQAAVVFAEGREVFLMAIQRSACALRFSTTPATELAAAVEHAEHGLEPPDLANNACIGGICCLATFSGELTSIAVPNKPTCW